MSQVIWAQVYFVLACLCSGMLLIACYDGLRFLRWLFPHARTVIWVEDFLFWVFASIPIFCLFFVLNDGIIRWYGLLGIFLGAILYEKGISAPIREFLRRYANKIRKICRCPFVKMRKNYRIRREKITVARKQKRIQKRESRQRRNQKKSRKTSIKMR